MTRTFALALLTVSALACGKQTFLVAAFVQTPALPNPTDPGSNIPQFQVMTAYFGTIDTTDPTKIDQSKEAPITDATANVSFMHKGTGGTDVDEARVLYDPNAAATTNKWTQSNGTYTLNSKDEPRLTFEVGTPYTLVLQTAGTDSEAFGARFVPAPPTDIKQFVDSKCTVDLGGGVSYDAPRCKEATASSLASTPLTIDRTDTPPAGQDPLPAFVLVGQIDPKNPSAEPQITYKTVPDSADKLLKYVLSDRDYRLNSFLIPTTAFPQAGYYIVSLLVVKQGKVSGNAFLGSTALSGSGAAGILHVQ
jgi:hypothetical protein